MLNGGPCRNEYSEEGIRIMDDVIVRPKLNTVLFAVCLAAVMIGQFLLRLDFSSLYFAVGCVLAILFSAVVSPFCVRVVSGLQFPRRENSSGRGFRVFCYVLPLAVFLLYYAAYYPGCFSVDSINQYQQVLTNQYNDWHPVLQTLLAFKIPLLLTGGWVGSIMLFQVVAFAAVLGYCFSIMEGIAGRRFTLVTMAYILLNPLTGNIAAYPWKDTTFAIGALLSVGFAVRIFESGGSWLRRKRNFALFAAVLAVTTVCRHNGVLFTAPLLLAVFLQFDRKRVLALILAVAALVLLVKGPLYAALHVEQPGARQVETLGLPMTVIGGAVTMAPEKTDPDILDFAYRIAPKEVWEKSFHRGSFNSIKWESSSDLSVIEEYGTGKILNMTWRCIRNTPYVSAVSILQLTEGLYAFTGRHPASITPAVNGGNPYGLELSPLIPGAYEFINAAQSYVTKFLPHVFLYYGTAHLILILTVLAKCRLNRLRDWKKILFVFPVFCYNFGTAVLLSGYEDIPRFFYYTLPVLPVLLLFFFREEKEVS